jgi:hypothetical protein
LYLPGAGRGKGKTLPAWMTKMDDARAPGETEKTPVTQPVVPCDKSVSKELISIPRACGSSSNDIPLGSRSQIMMDCSEQPVGDENGALAQEKISRKRVRGMNDNDIGSDEGGVLEDPEKRRRCEDKARDNKTHMVTIDEAEQNEQERQLLIVERLRGVVVKFTMRAHSLTIRQKSAEADARKHGEEAAAAAAAAAAAVAVSAALALLSLPDTLDEVEADALINATDKED